MGTLTQTAKRIGYANLIDLYLDWYNNYISVLTFADRYCLTYDMAYKLISKGGKVYESACSL